MYGLFKSVCHDLVTFTFIRRPICELNNTFTGFVVNSQELQLGGLMFYLKEWFMQLNAPLHSNAV